MFQSRRDVLKSVGLAAAATIAAGRGDWIAQPTGGLAGTILAFEPGARFASATLVRTGEQVRGGVPFVLAGAGGREFIVEVLRFDPDVPGVARAGSLAVYVANGGAGSAPTDEAQGLAAIALAEEIARREASGGRVPRLATMSHRGEPSAREAVG